MVKKAVAIVFLVESTEADNVVDQIQQQFDIELLHVESSYDKLWITKPDQEASNDRK